MLPCFLPTCHFSIFACYNKAVYSIGIVIKFQFCNSYFPPIFLSLVVNVLLQQIAGNEKDNQIYHDGIL